MYEKARQKTITLILKPDPFVLRVVYADWDGLTQDEADNLVAEGIVDNAWQAATLRQVFGEGKDGEITVSERSSLMATGLSAECIAHLAGPDGNAALRARARWFGAMVRNPDTQFKY